MAKKTILIVDDEPHIVELIELSLGDEYEYFVAKNGKEALAIVEKNRPDLVLLDIMMPGMDGFEVCRRLKGNQASKNLVIAMLSAKKEDHDILNGIDQGAIAYITKPFKPIELQEKVKELLSL